MSRSNSFRKAATSRKPRTWLILGAAVATMWFAAAGAAAWQEKTVWDGVYTDAQAKRGAGLYKEKCARCHADEMTGNGEASPLVGSEFSSNWNGLSLDALFTKIIVGMPEDAKGTLSRQQTADLLAAMFATAEMPSGKTELATAADQLKLIKYAGTKP